MSTQLAFHTFMRIEVLFFLVEHKKEPKNSLFFFVGKRLFLFVREQTKDEYGRTMGFVNYGEVGYVSHRLTTNEYYLAAKRANAALYVATSREVGSGVMLLTSHWLI